MTIERKQPVARRGRDDRGEKLSLRWAVDAPTTTTEPARAPAIERRAGWRNARLGAERAAAERAFATMRNREPGAPVELSGDRDRKARFAAVDEALREEWRRLRAAGGAAGA